VCQDDLIVLFSKSGNSEELIRLVPYAKVRPEMSPSGFAAVWSITLSGCEVAREGWLATSSSVRL